MTDVFDRNQAASYQFGDATAPEGFDPDVKGWRDPTPGEHIVKVVDYQVRTGKETNVRIRQGSDERMTVVHNQLEPRLQCDDDDTEAGATVIDFIPMPTPGVQLPALLANQWGQFIKSLGFDLPDGKLVPPGFSLENLIGRRCRAMVETQTTRDGETKLKKDGTPRVGIKMFGYSSLDKPARGSKTNASSTKAATPAPSAPPAQPAQFDL